MFMLSKSLSRVWTKLSFDWGDVYYYQRAPKWAKMAKSETKINGSEMKIETWEGERAIVMVNRSHEILVYHMKNGFSYINDRDAYDVVAKFPAEWLNITMMNLIEFRLGWHNRVKFAEEINAMIDMGIDMDYKGKSGWHYKVTLTGINFKYQKEKKLPEGYRPINPELIPMFFVVPEQQVEFAHDDGPEFTIVDLCNSNNIYHGPDDHYLFVAPASVVTSSRIKDTAFNLTKGDKKGWGNRLLTLAGDDQVIMNVQDAIETYGYKEPHLGVRILPSF